MVTLSSYSPKPNETVLQTSNHQKDIALPKHNTSIGVPYELLQVPKTSDDVEDNSVAVAKHSDEVQNVKLQVTIPHPMVE